MPKAARRDDPHACPMVDPGPTPHVGGPISSPCSPDVEIEDKPAARIGDFAKCEAGTPDFIRMGSPSVEINDMLAARVGDETVHGGVISDGASDVEIGIPGDGVALLPRESAPSRARPNGGAGSNAPSESNPDASNKPPTESGTNSPRDQKTSVVARWHLLSPEPIVEGGMAEFECWSYDPDTGGTEASPNPQAITYRNWEVSLLSSVTYTPADGRRTELEIPGPVDISQAIVALYVVDTQGDHDMWGRGVKVRPSRPVARIRSVPILHAPGSRAPALFECDSVWDDADTTTPVGTRIVRRTWVLERFNRTVPLMALPGPHGANSRVEIPKNLIPPIGDTSVMLSLEVENIFGRIASTRVPVAAAGPPIAKISKAERLNWRFFGTNEEFVGGDRLRVDSLAFMEGFGSLPNVGIDSFQWYTWTGLTWQTTPAGNGTSIEITLPDQMAISRMGVRLRVQNALGASETKAQGDNSNSGPAEEQDLIIDIVTWTEVFLRDMKDYLINAGITITVAALSEFFAFLAAGAAISRAAIVARGSIAQAFWFCFTKFIERYCGLTGEEAERVSGWVQLGKSAFTPVRGVLLNRNYLRGVYMAVRKELNYKASEAYRSAVKQVHALHLLLIGDIGKDLVERAIDDLFKQFEAEERRR